MHAAGCLLETTRRVAVNTVATLQVSFGGKRFDDVVHVVRCELMTKGGKIHHVAVRFLSVTPPHADSLRHAMRKKSSDVAGWLNDRVDK